MAKLTEQVLISWLHGNKPIDKLLKTTRSTIDSVEQLVNTKLKGEVQTKWLEKIEEYKVSNLETSLENANATFSKEHINAKADANTTFSEEEYINAKNELSLVEKELFDIEQRKTKLREEFDKLDSKSNELVNKKEDLLLKISELEQSLTINLVYDDTKIDKNNIKFFVTFNDAISDVSIDKNEVGKILAESFMYLPQNLNVQEAISLAQTVLFIKKVKKEGRIVKVYGPDDIIKFITSCDVLDSIEETIVT